MSLHRGRRELEMLILMRFCAILSKKIVTFVVIKTQLKPTFMKKAYKFLVLLIAMTIVSVNAFAAILKYQTEFRRGPGENYDITATVDKDRVINVLSPKVYDEQGNCWICVQDFFTMQRVGYVQIDKVEYDSFDFRSFEDASKFKTVYTKVSNFYLVNTSYITYKLDTLYLKATAKLKWWSLALLSVILALTALLIYLIHKYDKSYKKSWIHYILYLIAVIPTWALCEVSSIYVDNLDVLHSIALFLMAMIPAIVTINGGWGVRQCGMIDEKYPDNAHYVIGQIMQFPVWLWLIGMVWSIAVRPLLVWSETFEYHGGGFWRFVIGLGVALCIMGVILLIGYIKFMRHCLNKAGKYPICIMAIALWWAMIRIAYNWAYANFNGLGFILVVAFGGSVLSVIIIVTISQINATRCPYCHNCDGEETDCVDHGISYEHSTRWESISNSSIDPENRDAIVSDARRKLSITTAIHSWTTTHTCPNCGADWEIGHSEQVGSSSREIERRWTETY